MLNTKTLGIQPSNGEIIHEQKRGAARQSAGG